MDESLFSHLQSSSRRAVFKSIGGFSIVGLIKTTDPTNHIQTGVPTVETATHDHTVYTGDDVGVLHAFEPSGEKRWTFEVDTEHEDASYLAINSGPTVVNNIIYFGTGGFAPSSISTVYAVDTTTGEEQWRFEEASSPLVSCPTVVDGTVYIGSDDNNLYAINADSGEKIWNYETENWIRSSPTVVDGYVFVGGRDGYVHAVDAETGDRIWRTGIGEGTDGSPTIYKGNLFVGTNQGIVYSFDAATGNERWTFETGDSINTSPTCFDDYVFIGSDDETLYALNVIDGDIQWQLETDGEANTPTVYENTVYVGTDNGFIYAVKIESGEIVWQGPTNIEISGGSSTSVPTVVDDRIYIPHGRALMCLDRETGQARWNEALDGVAGGSPPTVVIGSGDGDSAGSRVRLGTLGHHHEWTDEQRGTIVPDYTGGDGTVEITDLRRAIEDFTDGNIDIEVLRTVIDTFG